MSRPTAQERLQHAHMLEFPLRWGLQRELGRCWVRMGGVKSALQIFTKLHMWRDVVSCYLALQKRKRAQKLVEELLAQKKTPGLLCLMGEVTGKPEPYLEAWELSGEKHTGAMTALAHLYHRKGDAANALKFAKVRRGSWGCRTGHRYNRRPTCRTCADTSVRIRVAFPTRRRPWRATASTRTRGSWWASAP